MSLHIHSKNCYRKSIIRGVLTNGRGWIFILLKFKKDGDGGEYFLSDQYNIIGEYGIGISSKTSPLIVAIIAHWVGFCDYL